MGVSDGDADVGVPPCVRKLLPCLDYLRSQEKPPAACCVPLGSALDEEIECLCKLFFDDHLLESLNISQSQILGFPPRCGLKAPDVTKCKFSSDAPKPSPIPPHASSPPTSTPKAPSSSSAAIGINITSVLALIIIWVFSVTSPF
ncbi:non-specific lipid transfer protein GPI-anchored 3-like [Musa acuminata AAA Group]|uniref:non-specific lipid transfer protein GPI-anchored 3-like n=1 Tax=Musa acuminata AAA Group TaxID=214697 RepID=UPI0031DC1440